MILHKANQQRLEMEEIKKQENLKRQDYLSYLKKQA
jgi:hypothetical protein